MNVDHLEDQIKKLWCCIEAQTDHNNQADKKFRGLETHHDSLCRSQVEFEERLKGFDQRIDSTEAYAKKRMASFHEAIATQNDNIKRLYTYVNEYKMARIVKYGSVLSTPRPPSLRRALKNKRKSTTNDSNVSPTPLKVSPICFSHKHIKESDLQSPTPLRTSSNGRGGGLLPLNLVPRTSSVQIHGQTDSTTPTSPSGAIESPRTPMHGNKKTGFLYHVIEEQSPAQNLTSPKLLSPSSNLNSPSTFDPDFDHNPTIIGRSLAIEVGEAPFSPFGKPEGEPSNPEFDLEWEMEEISKGTFMDNNVHDDEPVERCKTIPADHGNANSETLTDAGETTVNEHNNGGKGGESAQDMAVEDSQRATSDEQSGETRKDPPLSATVQELTVEGLQSSDQHSNDMVVIEEEQHVSTTAQELQHDDTLVIEEEQHVSIAMAVEGLNEHSGDTSTVNEEELHPDDVLIVVEERHVSIAQEMAVERSNEYSGNIFTVNEEKQHIDDVPIVNEENRNKSSANYPPVSEIPQEAAIKGLECSNDHSDDDFILKCSDEYSNDTLVNEHISDTSTVNEQQQHADDTLVVDEEQQSNSAIAQEVPIEDSNEHNGNTFTVNEEKQRTDNMPSNSSIADEEQEEQESDTVNLPVATCSLANGQPISVNLPIKSQEFSDEDAEEHDHRCHDRCFAGSGTDADDGEIDEVIRDIETKGPSDQGPKRGASKVRELRWANVLKSVPLGIILIVIVVTTTIIFIGIGLGLAICISCLDGPHNGCSPNSHPTYYSPKFGNIKLKA